MIAEIEFDYSTSTVLEKDRAKYERVRAALPLMDLTEWKEDAEKPPHIWLQKTLIDLTTEGPMLAQEGLKFTVRRFKGAYRVAGTESLTSVNTTLQIAIPAIGLLAMDEVLLLDDACTDNLQSHLNQGWRIIAVCPPDAQRRPDYILGRSEAARPKP